MKQTSPIQSINNQQPDFNQQPDVNQQPDFNQQPYFQNKYNPYIQPFRSQLPLANSIQNNVYGEMNVTYLVFTYNLQITAVVVIIVGFLIVISLLLFNMYKKSKSIQKTKM
jgi:uncharacterized membrane protein YbaN (DUF454 family)